MKKLPKSILDIVDRDRIVNLARRGYGPEGIADKAIPPNLRMRAPRRISCNVYDADGELFAACSREIADERYASRPGFRVEELPVHPYHVGLWRWNEARMAEILAIWMELSEADLIDYDDIAVLPAENLYRQIGEAVGASRFRTIGRGEALGYAPGFGGRGVELQGSCGRVYIDAGVESGRLYVAQIATERRGEGIGTRIMEAMRGHCAGKSVGMTVYKVCNKKFFARFDWLTPKDGGGEYLAEAEDMRPDPVTSIGIG